MIVMPTLSPTVSVRPDALTAGQAEKSILCLDLAPQRLRLTLLDPQRRMVWLDEYAQPTLLTEESLLTQLPTLFGDHPLLHYDQFQQIRVAVNASAFTLIPNELYRKEYASNYLTLMRGHQPPPNEIASAYEHNEGFTVVFGLDRAITEFVGGQYPLQPITYVHQASTLIRATQPIDKQEPETQNLFLHFEEEFAFVLFREERKLRYCNRFGYKNVQDLVYYVLYVADELGVDPDTLNVLAYGEITPFAEAYIALSRFLPNLHIGSPPSGLNPAPDLADLPEHRYLDLQGLCLLS
ncbi:hypothetical protein FAES_2828 [Fibrella aestuarina BUZ 2]|uniref:DUF3822 domain-containing protein n=2 Tax=Fibrella TaxID=861914 RepID=I0K9N4_9BACT|nr:hypothetical protein FAES_2828 [Fibrella aestuarina BUZ 2]